MTALYWLLNHCLFPPYVEPVAVATQLIRRAHFFCFSYKPKTLSFYWSLHLHSLTSFLQLCYQRMRVPCCITKAARRDLYAMTQKRIEERILRSSSQKRRMLLSTLLLVQFRFRLDILAEKRTRVKRVSCGTLHAVNIIARNVIFCWFQRSLLVKIHVQVLTSNRAARHWNRSTGQPTAPIYHFLTVVNAVVPAMCWISSQKVCAHRITTPVPCLWQLF